MPDVIETAWPSQCAQTSGVRIDQGMSAKRLAKNGAVAVHDVVLRLEPGDVMRFLFTADFAEADGVCILC